MKMTFISKYAWIVVILNWIVLPIRAQYFVDVFSLNNQWHQAKSQDDSIAQKGSNTFMNLFVPVPLAKGNTFLFRLSGEQLLLTNDSAQVRLQSLTMPVGMQWKFKNPKWKLTTLGIPKWSGTDRHLAFHDNFQYGVYLLGQYTVSDSLRFKLGIYVNREFFGNLIVPLIGVDWKINHRWSIYGTLPSNFRLSYSIQPQILNMGVGFKSMARSFRSQTEDQFIRYNELQLKYFMEAILAKHYTFFVEGGFFLGRAPLLYTNGANRDEYESSDLLRLMKPFPMMNIGMAYRVFQ
jgi:hypothetical protein